MAAISSADALFINGQPGNNVTLPSDDRELFNAADLNNVSDGFTDLMGLKVVQGRKFTASQGTVATPMYLSPSAACMPTCGFIRSAIPTSGQA